jgi:myo-inositol 2-dehydrogenase / D-chiro-inositol 1-dehydrogenase
MEWKIGVIGTGAIGRDHIRRLAEVVHGAHVVALSDVNAEVAQKVAAQYHSVFYKTGEEVIHDGNVDAVLIASWDPSHAGYVLECIRAGKFVFCEKPLATSAEECLKIVEAEMRCGNKLVQVGFMRRYDHGYRELKRVIESGKIGAPLLLHCCHRNLLPGPTHTTDMTVKNSGIHEIDVLRWLLHEDYESGQVILPKCNGNAASDLVDPQIMLLRTKSGVCIDVEINMNSGYGYDIQCEIVGEKGTARLSDPNTILTRTRGYCSYPLYSDWSQRFVDAYNVELQEWIDSLCEKGMPTGPSAWDGYIACVTADSLGRARENGTVEKITVEMQPEFYQ